MTDSHISEAELLQALESRYESKEFQLLRWTVISLNENGRVGFLGDHFKLEAFVQRIGQTETISFFIKTLPANKMHKKTVQGCHMFRKEVLFYGRIASKLSSVLSTVYQSSTGASVIPKCYLTNDRVIVMEDLWKWNYRSLNTAESLTLDFVIVGLRAVSHLHAASIGLERKLHKSISEEFPDLSFETTLMTEPDHFLTGFYASYLDAAIALVPLLDRCKNNPEAIKKTQEALPVLLKEVFAEFRECPTTTNVVCHGDLWKNNLLFRLTEDGKPIEAVLVDFQMMRFAPPATDIVMFLLFNTDKRFRDEHFIEMVREYYSELSRTLLRLGIDVNKVLSWEELQRTIRKMKKLGLVLMTIKYPFVFAPPEFHAPVFASDELYWHHHFVDRKNYMIKLFTDYAPFRSRYSEVMGELIDDYILKP